ncbi:MAG: EpsI family protein, partial [Chthoniobacterales bacterium]|nr:EpsI family protein [Chthoniobacterales bacterium]
MSGCEELKVVGVGGGLGEEKGKRDFGAKNWIIIAIFIGLCLFVSVVVDFTARAVVVPEAGVVMDLPGSVMGMAGHDVEVSEAELTILPKDTQFAKRAYNDERGNSIILQIVLSGGDRRSIHRPETCLPGQGWNILSNQPERIELRDGRYLKVQKLRLARDVNVPGVGRKTMTMLFLYWYVGSGLTTNSQLERILRSNLDLLFYNRVHRWAYVIVSSPVLGGLTQNGLTETETMERLKEFVREVV